MREPLSRGALILVAAGLWLGTAVVGLWEIMVVRELLFRLFAHFTPYGIADYAGFKQAQTAGALGTLLVFVLAVIWIATIIGGGEYHRTRVGRPESWRLFGYTIAVELSIAFLPFFI